MTERMFSRWVDSQDVNHNKSKENERNYVMNANFNFSSLLAEFTEK